MKTRTQIEELIGFIRNWENASLCIEDARTGKESHEEQFRIVQQQHAEAAHIMRENRAISKFKRDIIKQMQMSGLIEGKGKGKGRSYKRIQPWINER